MPNAPPGRCSSARTHVARPGEQGNLRDHARGGVLGGFGVPVALVGYMHRDLVERRGWISEEDYKEGLALAQMMPGPSVRHVSPSAARYAA